MMYVEEPSSLESLKHHFNFIRDKPQESILKNLKTANVTHLRGKEGASISVLELPLKVDYANTAQPTTLYIREFYRRYFDLLRKSRCSVVMGNPGISKSWFQWYILYCLVNEKVVPTLGPNHLNSIEPPKVIVRQVQDTTLYFYFPHCDKVYQTGLDKILLTCLKPNTALYLVEPGESHAEPFRCELQTIITCSPDRIRYKGFVKGGAILRYMPCWTLDELQIVGAHVAACCDESWKHFYTPEAIERRHCRFGGIIRYVIPANRSILDFARREQRNVILAENPKKSLEPSSNIEKRDDMKQNISHFIFQYDVKYGGEYGGSDDEFLEFDMNFTSDYAKKEVLDNLLNKLSDDEFKEVVRSLQRMFIGGVTSNPCLFGIVVGEAIVRRQKLKWEVFEKGEWSTHDWAHFEKIEYVAKGDENVKNMEQGVLYYPADSRFLLDFVFVKLEEGKKRVFGIQVTFAEKHAKKLSVHEDAYERLGNNKNEDEMRIYVIPNPQHAVKYAKRKSEDFVKEGKLERVHYSTVKLNFDDPTIKLT